MVKIGGLLLALFSVASGAADYKFSDHLRGDPARYQDFLSKLKAGDRLTFGDGKTLQIGDKLGAGTHTVIYELAGASDRVLRLPIDQSSGEGMLRSFVAGHAPLKREGIPVIELFDSWKGEYAVVEKIDHYKGKFYTLDSFVEAGPPNSREARFLKEKIVEFGKQSARFELFGDFTPSGLAWDDKKKQWRLVDWSSQHKMFDKRFSESQSNVFANRLSYYLSTTPGKTGFLPRPTWAQQFNKELNEIVNKVRKSPSFTPSDCSAQLGKVF